MNVYQILVIAVVVVMSIVGFASMAIDKKRAREGKWRIKEATLFLIALLFGGIGSTIGMYAKRHKTNHWYFVVGMPLLAIINIALAVFLFITLA